LARVSFACIHCTRHSSFSLIFASLCVSLIIQGYFGIISWGA
jgi:hypothetical protein